MLVIVKILEELNSRRCCVRRLQDRIRASPFKWQSRSHQDKHFSLSDPSHDNKHLIIGELGELPAARNDVDKSILTAIWNFVLFMRNLKSTRAWIKFKLQAETNPNKSSLTLNCIHLLSTFTVRSCSLNEFWCRMPMTWLDCSTLPTNRTFLMTLPSLLWDGSRTYLPRWRRGESRKWFTSDGNKSCERSTTERWPHVTLSSPFMSHNYCWMAIFLFTTSRVITQ